MTTVQQIYEEMQRIAPLALAESWDNLATGDCGGEVSRVLVTLDITRGGGRGRPEGLRAHRVPPPGHLLAPPKA